MYLSIIISILPVSWAAACIFDVMCTWALGDWLVHCSPSNIDNLYHRSSQEVWLFVENQINHWQFLHFSRIRKINYLTTQASPRNGENPLPAFVHCVHHPACRQVRLSGWGVWPRAKRWQVRSPNSSFLWLSRQQSHCCLYVGIPPANVLFPSILIETHWKLH